MNKIKLSKDQNTKKLYQCNKSFKMYKLNYLTKKIEGTEHVIWKCLVLYSQTQDREHALVAEPINF